VQAKAKAWTDLAAKITAKGEASGCPHTAEDDPAHTETYPEILPDLDRRKGKAA
jgi:hypothetical protein